MKTAGWIGRAALAAAVTWLAVCPTVRAQSLNFSNHRKYEPPDYWTFRLGPFYSNMRFSQSAGYRFTHTSGTNTDYVFRSGKAETVKDGEEFPLVSTLTFRNYLLISDSMDLDASITVKYAHYPMETQEDEFSVNLAEEGMFGDLSTAFDITPDMKAVVYDKPVYRTDYVDTRGIADKYGGTRFRQFQNTAGIDIDWLIGEVSNAGLKFSRDDLLPQEKSSFDDQERTTHAGQLSYEVMVNMFTVAGVRGGWSQNRYVSTNRTDTSVIEYGAYTGMKVTEKTTASLSAGYSQSFLDRTNGTETADGEGTWVGQADVSTMFTPNLSQVLFASRTQKAGFNSPFEINGSYGYSLQWGADGFKASLKSTMAIVDPNGRENVNGYSDWATELSLTVPLVQDFMSLELSSRYTERVNEKTETKTGSAEWHSDYSTWVHRAGTSFLVCDEVTFSTAYTRMDRKSDDDERLAYSRDVFEATLTYSHEF